MIVRTLVQLGICVIVPICLSCGAAQRPLPCMSDRECHGDRICDAGRCRFWSAVPNSRFAQHVPQLPQTTADKASIDKISAGNLSEVPTDVHRESATRRVGRSGYVGPDRLPTVQWSFTTQGRIYASPVWVPQKKQILLASLDKTLSAINLQGKLAWRYTATHKFYSTPTVTQNDQIVVGSDSQEVLALNLHGQLLWKTRLNATIDARPVIDSRGDVFVSADGLYALTKEGVVRWHVPTAGHVRAGPTLFEEAGLVIVGTPEGTVLAVNMINGKTVWETHSGASIDASPAVSDDGTIIIGNDLGHLLALDRAGKILWRYVTEGDIRATPAIDRYGNIYVGSYDRGFYAISANGVLRWKFDTSGRIRASALIDAANRVYIGSQDDMLYALTTDGQELWRYNVGEDIDAQVVLAPNGTLFIGADDGKLYAFK